MKLKQGIMLALLLSMLGGCARSVPSQPEPPYTQPVVLEEVWIEEEAVALSESPAALPKILQAEASGTKVKQGNKAVIDYSNTADGYVMVRYTAPTEKRLKAQVKGPSTTYTYNLTPEDWTVFPLSDGNGSYQIAVYQNVVDKKYATLTSVSCTVTLNNEYAPFLLPNQFVDYDAASQTVAKAAELVGTESDTLKKVSVIYDYVIHTLTYDREKTAAVQSGYLPVLDTVLEQQKGICFDYAALMAGMLRSQGVPCKLVVGYAGSAYHAWISVWTEESGWIDGVICFDGQSWKRMDPTYASSG